ncbi:MAG: 6-phosphogluconolactonase [Gammaproteobacteria bacterium]
MSWTEILHRDADALAESLAGTLEAAIRAGLAGRGRAVLALAGGRTPFPIYRRLAEASLDWSGVLLLPTDERWVDPNHPACNAREMRAAFAAAAGVKVMPLVPQVAGPIADTERADEMLADLADPFDAVLLGMGADGHFASLFPGAAGLAAGLDSHGPDDALVVHPEPLPPEAPYARISLSTARLLRTRRLMLAATGASKRAVLDRAQARPDPINLPISALLHDPAAQVEIHWSP